MMEEDFEPELISKPFLDFAAVARENFDKAKAYYKKREPLNKEYRKILASWKSDGFKDDVWIEADNFHSEHITPIETELNMCCILTIVLAAFAVEGYIYYYAIKNLRPKLVKDHLDKLNILGKLLVIPQLVTGKEFPMNGEAYNLIKKLISNRNYFVHSKAIPYLALDEKRKEPVPSGKVKKLVEMENNLFKHAEDAIKALDKLSEVMKNIDPKERSSGVFEGKRVQWVIPPLL